MIRVAFMTAALTAIGYFSVVGAEPGQPPFPNPTGGLPKGEVDPKMPMFMVCAKACDDCARICDTCSAHCARLLAEGKKEHFETLRLCQDCAAMCTAAARIAGKDGPMSDLMYPVCAEACKRCGAACEKHAGDPMLKQCAEECRRCEKMCRDMTAKPATPKE